MNESQDLLSAEYDVTFYVACYNEEQGIVPTLETVLAAVEEVDRTCDIVIIDDASSDRSVEIIRKYMREHPETPITLVINHVNQGIGHNFVDAAFLGRGKYYRMICGDDVESKENIVRLLERLGEADILLSYPADASARSPWRRIVSRTFVHLVNLLSGHKIRYYNNLPVFLRTQVLRWHSNSHGFGFQADMVTRLLDFGATYIEVPAIARERTAGRTKAFKFKNICSVGHTLLEILARRIARTLFPSHTRKFHCGQTISRNEAARWRSAAEDSALGVPFEADAKVLPASPKG